MSIMAESSNNWIFEYEWYLEDPTSDFINWSPSKVIFRKVNIPSGNALYQVRLRRELFYFLYQTEEEKEKLYPIGSSFGTTPFDIEFRDNFSFMIRNRNGMFFNSGERVGKQENNRYPLVGIWGSLPSLNEYRLVDPSDYVFYMEINKQIPGMALREGTYLLRQTGENVFETISSFPDGFLRLELKNENTLFLTPLFTLPEGERGRVIPLNVRRSTS